MTLLQTSAKSKYFVVEYHIHDKVIPFKYILIWIQLTPKMIDFQEKHNIKLLKGYVYSPNDKSISNKPPMLLKAFNFYYDS